MGEREPRWEIICGPRPPCRRFLITIVLLGWMFGFDSSMGMGQEKPAPPEHSAENDQLRDITGIEEPAHAPARAWWPFILGIASLLLMSLFLVTWRYYYQNSNQGEMLPGHWALAELDRIVAQSRSALGDQLERYPTMLSEVIRLYLEKRFQLRASRQTTPEFFQAIKNSTLLSPSHRELLMDFLERCDLGKFAQIQFTKEECQTLAQAAREFVEQTVA
jgi:hypothetical protein